MITEQPGVPESVPPMVDDGTQTFDEYAATLPETAQGFLNEALPQAVPDGVEDAGFLGGTVSESASDGPTPRKRINISKNMRKSMKKFRTKIASAPINWFHAQAKDNPEWELDDEEKELMTDSIGTVLDVLEIEFEIQPLSMTLTSIWWVISYPLLAFAFLFLTKKSVVMAKQKSTEQTEETKQ